MATIEGNEKVERNAIMCIGEANDAWQQNGENLIKKYNIVGFTDDGWMICEPKPDNEVEFIQLDEEFFIEAQWGEEKPGFKNPVQYGKLGSYVLRNIEDNSDVWVVEKKVFENTYEKK